MRIPTWFKGMCATALLGSIAWAFDMGQRVSTLEAYIKESIKRLDRIERKLDYIRERE